MQIVIVVEKPRDWPFRVAGVEVAAADRYLTQVDYTDIRGARVFNLCRSYGYQRTGYYVSLLAEARGHRPIPTVSVLQDMKSAAILRVASRELDEVIQKSLGDIRADTFELSVYFGRNLARRHRQLALRLFNAFPAPLLRASFERQGRWRLRKIRVISADKVRESHRNFVAEAAAAYFAGRRPRQRPARRSGRYDLAILRNADETDPPSNNKAIREFVRAAGRVGLDAELITRDDYGRLAEFDALFIRETTAVNHHTFRFAQRAAAEGLVVIDDPRSIVRCTNKLFLAEVAEHHGLRVPRTVIVGRGGDGLVARTVGLPCVLKQPDGAYSRGVVKVDTAAELRAALDRLLIETDFVVAQEFLPSPFDWRVGVLAGKPLFVCKYHMAVNHWQIIRRDGLRTRVGQVESLDLAAAPARVVRAALRATRHFGDGFYGVDLKQIAGKVYLIEVNDNPSVDAGYEDAAAGRGLYEAVMQSFLDRLEARGKRESRR